MLMQHSVNSKPQGWPLILAAILFLPFAAIAASGQAAASAPDAGVAVGPQYDSTHVYVSPSNLSAFVASIAATFGGQASKRIVVNVLPVPSSEEWQFLSTPVGALSVFAFQTPIPFPIGQERTGYLVTDMDTALRDARADGAEVIVAPWKDPIGNDAVIQWPGGLMMQLYSHFTPPRLRLSPRFRITASMFRLTTRSLSSMIS